MYWLSSVFYCCQIGPLGNIICSMNNIHTKRTKRIRQTFTLPDEVFRRFASLVPGGQRSAVISALLEEETRKRELALERACEAANKDAHLLEVEQDFQSLENTVSESFDDHAW